MFESLILNAATGIVRRETLEGKEHFVVPVAMITEGVWPGNEGPILYRKEVLIQNMSSWDHKPIVVYHPEKDGKAVTACSPEFLNTSKIGIVLNTHYDNKLRCEAWIDVERCREVDERVYNAIVTNSPMNVSTGMALQAKEAKEAKEFGGKSYKKDAVKITPDHLAILPDQNAACSVKDGAGLLITNADGKVTASEDFWKGKFAGYALAFEKDYTKKKDKIVTNGLSFSQISDRLCEALKSQFGIPGEMWDGWIVEIYPTSVIYYNAGLYSIGYSATGDTVSLVGDPVPVERMTSYKKEDGTLVTNRSDESMKETLIAALITNGSGVWTVEDKPTLLTLSEDKLRKLVELGKAPTTQVQNQNPVVTLDQLVMNADPATQAAFAQIKADAERVREQHIQVINSNPGNKFDEAFLKDLNPKLLEGIASIAAVGVQRVNNHTGYYTGVGGYQGSIFKGVAGGNVPDLNQQVQNAAGGKAKGPLIAPEL